MARCEGTTRGGDRCKRDARPDSRFCHAHTPHEEQSGDRGPGTLEWEDFLPLLFAGVMAAGFVFLLRSFGRWIPRF